MPSSKAGASKREAPCLRPFRIFLSNPGGDFLLGHRYIVNLHTERRERIFDCPGYGGRYDHALTFAASL